MLGLKTDRAGAAFDFYHVDQHTLVIPVGKSAGPATDPEDGEPSDEDSPTPGDGSLRVDCAPAPAAAGGERTDSDSDRSAAGADSAAASAATSDGIQIICRYDSARSPPPAESSQPLSCLQPAPVAPAVDIGDFSSIVEIDGDCVIIHSRLDDDASASAAAAGTPILERCRRFYEGRLRARRPAPDAADEVVDTDDTDDGPPSVDSGRESGSDSHGADVERPEKPLKPASSLERKMALLRREMWSLMHQDDDLFRQLLALNDSIEALKQGEGSLSPASSLSSLPELADESISPSSTLSSSFSRQSHLSTDSGNYALIKCKYRSQPHLESEALMLAGGTRLVGSRSCCEVTPPSARQATPPSFRPLEKQLQPGRHRKQGSCDSGIVDQEIREPA